MDNQMIDPKYLAILQAGLGILSGNTGRQPVGATIGQGLLGGVAGYQQNLQAQQEAEMRKQQLDMQNQQFGWQKEKYDAGRQQAEQQKALFRELAPDYGIDPRVLSAYPSIGEDVIKNKLLPKPKKIAFAPNGIAYDETNPTLKEGENYSKVEPIDYNKPLLPDGTPNVAYQNYDLNRQKAGATSNNIEVNTGQKGFDNTLKLRGDFRSEPIYKAHQEVQSAHSQIKAALKQASPAGDLAGATKIMKILDPGSVVRESELGMAMAASGAFDRLTNYAEMTLKGTKLTPTQRADFQTLADSLYNESVKQYNTKRQEYKGIANRNDINEADVLGDEASLANKETLKDEKIPSNTYTSLPKKAPKGQIVRNPKTGERKQFDGLIWKTIK